MKCKYARLAGRICIAGMQLPRHKIMGVLLGYAAFAGKIAAVRRESSPQPGSKAAEGAGFDAERSGKRTGTR
ncbi:hypothetical protein D3C72_1884100 [compost metagenome]